MESVIEWLRSMVLVLLLSLMGGFAHAAQKREKSPWVWFCCSIVAMFSGVIVSMLLSELTSTSEQLRTALSSLAAYSGGKVLDICYLRLAIFMDGILGQTPRK